jgi:hypothetical protein
MESVPSRNVDRPGYQRLSPHLTDFSRPRERFMAKRHFSEFSEISEALVTNERENNKATKLRNNDINKDK